MNFEFIVDFAEDIAVRDKSWQNFITSENENTLGEKTVQSDETGCASSATDHNTLDDSKASS